MARDTDIGIQIKYLYDSAGVRRASKDLQGLEKTGKQTSGTLGKIKDNWKAIGAASLAVGGALFTAKKAFDMAAEGQKILQVRDTFDKLTMSIGETAEVMLGDLRTATGSMVSDTELMMSANRFMSMGLAESADQASFLSEAAVTLGQAMGKEAGPALEEFALLLANRSIPRLDTFGISAAEVRAKMERLKESGMGIEEAFNTAVMEEATTAMDRLGGELPIDPYQQLIVEVDNFTDAAKTSLAEALLPTVNLLTGKYKRAIENFVAENIDATKSTEELERAGKRLADTYNSTNAFGIGEEGGFGAFIQNLNASGEGIVKLGRAFGNQTDDFEEWLGMLDKAGVDLDTLWRVVQNAESLPFGTTPESFFRAIREEIENLDDAFNNAAVDEKLSRFIKVNDEATESTKRGYDSTKTASAISQEYVGWLINRTEETERATDATEALEAVTRALNSASIKEFMGILDGGDLEFFDTTLDDLANGVGNLDLDQQALNDALFEAIGAAAQSADEFDALDGILGNVTEQVAAYGLALGTLDEDQAMAAIKQQALNAKIAELGPLVASGALTLGDANWILGEFEKSLEDTTVDAGGLGEGIDSTREKALNWVLNSPYSAFLELDGEEAKRLLDAYEAQLLRMERTYHARFQITVDSPGTAGALPIPEGPVDPFDPGTNTGGSGGDDLPPPPSNIPEEPTVVPDTLGTQGVGRGTVIVQVNGGDRDEVLRTIEDAFIAAGFNDDIQRRLGG